MILNPSHNITSQLLGGVSMVWPQLIIWQKIIIFFHISVIEKRWIGSVKAGMNATID
tara:strand:+ start:171 stop:341 length:171 start_codon:yes stop_codon:yes gene_type:complete